MNLATKETKREIEKKSNLYQIIACINHIIMVQYQFPYF